VNNRFDAGQLAVGILPCRPHGNVGHRPPPEDAHKHKEYADQIQSMISGTFRPTRICLSRLINRAISRWGHSQVRLDNIVIVSNSLKKGDNMTLVIDKIQRDLVSVSIASYLDDPSDAVNVSVQFRGTPGGPNHVSSETINGIRKQVDDHDSKQQLPEALSRT
jgi:hypothetical protein